MKTTIRFSDLLNQYLNLVDHDDQAFRHGLSLLNHANNDDEMNEALHALKTIAIDYPYCYAFLASLYFEGRLVEKNVKRGLYYLHKGIKANDPTSILQLGVDLLNGTNHARNIKRAYRFIEKAASLGLPIAMLMFGSINLGYEEVEANYEVAYTYFKKLADENRGEGYAFLGLMYERGLGVPVNGVEAVRNYLKSCSLENHLGHLFFGKFYLSGSLYPKSIGSAIEHFRWSSNNGNLDATRELIDLYLSEQRDALLLEAKTLIDDLLRRRHPLGSYYYAKAALQGLIYPVQTTKIIRLLKESNVPDAYYLWGKLYVEGIHVKRNIKKAIKIFDEGINQSSFECLYASLDLSLQQVEAKPHYLLMLIGLSEAHHHEADYYLGRLYYEGIAFTKNYSQAYSCFLSSGHFKSYRYLGMIEEHRGPQEVISKATNYYYQGIEEKDWDCYYNLALIYHDHPSLGAMEKEYLIKGAEKKSLLCLKELVSYYQKLNSNLAYTYMKEAALLGDEEAIEWIKNHEENPS